MATFPTTILWDKATSARRSHGLAVARMEDGKAHMQTFYTTPVESFRVVHAMLDQSERDTVVSFLDANTGVDFDLVHPLSGTTYTGKLVGELSESFDGDVHYRLSWPFEGRPV